MTKGEESQNPVVLKETFLKRKKTKRSTLFSLRESCSRNSETLLAALYLCGTRDPSLSESGYSGPLRQASVPVTSYKIRFEKTLEKCSLRVHRQILEGPIFGISCLWMTTSERRCPTSLLEIWYPPHLCMCLGKKKKRAFCERVCAQPYRRRFPRSLNRRRFRGESHESNYRSLCSCCICAVLRMSGEETWIAQIG